MPFSWPMRIAKLFRLPRLRAISSSSESRPQGSSPPVESYSSPAELARDPDGYLFLVWSAEKLKPDPHCGYMDGLGEGHAWVVGNGLGVRKGSILRMHHPIFGNNFKVIGVTYRMSEPGLFQAAVIPHFEPTMEQGQ